MDHERVETWEAALSDEQRERLAALRARKCRVEAVFVSADEQNGIPAHVRLSAVIDHVLLAVQHEQNDIGAAFDVLYLEVETKLTLPDSSRPKPLN
ncbi:hypothetical protein [Deinococcus yavapaiensis]|uniref:Uncharacterized protein n=1 Tax=Deinococcus yavapaiensis KR-236 TaxID=694435 RepID=A0A318SBZ4_9DEIO|nr:hypothetical protein [Deinococcus yavapaiensis]PYE53830.1 hypothetical protein DES52_10788 [Deinococcus yavapaiensis KR-236]